MSTPGNNEEESRRDHKTTTPSSGSAAGFGPFKKIPDITHWTSTSVATLSSAPSRHQSHHPPKPDRDTSLQRDEPDHQISTMKTKMDRPKDSQIAIPGSTISRRAATGMPLTLASQQAGDTQNVHKPTIAPPVNAASLRVDESRRQNSSTSTIRQLIELPSAPPSTASILTQPEDFKFALRQTKIESMRPNEREEQEKWAQSLIQRSGVCPEGYTWNRMSGGYQCMGGGHGMTDELIAEGKAGLLAVRTKKWGVWDGPWYPNPTGKGFVKGTSYTDDHELSK